MIHTKLHFDPHSSTQNNQNQRTVEKYICRYATEDMKTEKNSE